MHKSGYLFVLTAGSLLGFAFSEPVVVKRKAPTHIIRSKVGEYEKKLDTIMDKLWSLKREETDEKELKRVRDWSDPYRSSTRSAESPTMHPTHLNTYLNLLSNPMNYPAQGFLHSLPHAVVCLLTNGSDCGWQAELIVVLWSQLREPMMSLLSSVKSQTCSLNPGAQTDPQLGDHLNAFQELLSATLVSPSFVTAWKNFVDLSLPSLISYASQVTVNVLEASVELLMLSLQLVIETPTLEQIQQCPQGDLKQLLMWGIRNNLSWPFEDSLLNIFLTPAEVPPCSFTDLECQGAHTTQGSRSSMPPLNDPSKRLSCDQQDVTPLNDTLCAEILVSRAQVPDILYHICKALSSLSHAEIIQVWRNSCQLIEQVLSPLLEPCSPSGSSQRVVRSASLSQFCNYESWTSETAIDPAAVTMCFDNEPAVFLDGVCNNAAMMQTLIANPSNSWVWEYCANASERYIIWQFCLYESWIPQAVDPSIVALCWDNDRARMEKLLCQNLDFYTIVFSDPVNVWLVPNCIHVPPSEPAAISMLVAEFCRYSEWHFIGAVTTDQISLCIQNDEPRFLSQVCTNSTFLTALVLDENNAWVGQYCTLNTEDPVLPVGTSTVHSSSSSVSSNMLFPTMTPTDSQGDFSITAPNATLPSSFPSSTLSISTLSSITPPPMNASTPLPVTPTFTIPKISPTSPTLSPAIPSVSDLCKYVAWLVLPVSPTVIGLCWKFDVLAFHLNVCCNTRLFEHLTLDPQNLWLRSVCSENVMTVVLPQVCLYSEWSKPTVVDMTDLALCADLDTENFMQKVCVNTTMLHNLLANLDNTWLLEQCANLTGSGEVSMMGFRPSEQCQYATWTGNLPSAALLALCWDYDQANFISSVCLRPALLSYIIQEPTSLWVSTLCATYSNYTGGSQFNASSTNTSTNEPQLCLVKETIERLNWSCRVDLDVVCQPESPRFQVLQAFLRCGMEEMMTTQTLATVVRQATSLWVVLLLVLEENGMTTLAVTDHIGQSVLDAVSAFLEREMHSDNKQVLLQCFASVLTNLMQTGRDVSSVSSFFIKEYFQIPLTNLEAVLGLVGVSTVRQILQFFTRNQANLQLNDEYLRAMVSVLLRVHLRQDITLLFDLRPLMSFAAPEDIRSLPALQDNVVVLNTINTIINSLALGQRQAFGSWFSQSLNVTNVTADGLSFIRDTGNLIAYLPFRSFQHLSPAQLLDGLDVLLRNDLGTMKRQFIALRITGAYRNLTAEEFKRLGSLTCQAKPSDLLAYEGSSVFSVIQENIRTCAAQGMSIPSNMISSVFLNASERQSPATFRPQRVSQLAPFLPLLGVDFLQQLSPFQLLPALGDLASVPFTPLQAATIVDKVTSSLNLSDAGTLSKLGSLLSGVRVEALSGLPADALLLTLSNVSTYTAPQFNAIATKLWGSPAVITGLEKVEPLLFNTPLLSVTAQTRLLLTKSLALYERTWNTQQAKSLFNEAVSTVQSPTLQQFMSLGTVASGVSCNVLTKLFKSSASMSSIGDILKVLREQPVPLHPSLKKCVIEELYKYNFIPELLGQMGAQIALSFPTSTFKKFSKDMMDSLRKMILQDPQYFLLMPRIKQSMLVEKIVDRLGLQTGTYSEDEFRLLGVMATSVADEVFLKLDRSFFVDRIEFLQGFCYDRGKRDIVASVLQEQSTFGPAETWTEATLDQINRFLFFLSKETMQQIPLDLMSQERIERLFGSQHQWEIGDVGSRCEQERDALFPQKQFVLQYFLGLARPERSSSLIPSCEILHVTQPAAWPVSSLTSMPSAAFQSCLELIGRDLAFSPYQLTLLLRKTKEVYGSVTSFTPSVTAQLGQIATQLSMDELASLKVSEIRFVAPLGAVNTWTRKQLGVLFSTILDTSRQTPSQLDSSFFVALGHIVCGIEASVMASLNPAEFSKAVLCLGRLNLSCSEEQFRAMIDLLRQDVAFGSISSWGPEVFIEIGAFAAGIPDLSMSALVKEQIEGITPLAIALMPAQKFAVVFNHEQISLFSYEQAAAVTAAQRSALSPLQDTALSMVLNPLEDRPVDFRGRSLGVVTSLCPVCLLCSLLVFFCCWA